MTYELELTEINEIKSQALNRYRNLLIQKDVEKSVISILFKSAKLILLRIRKYSTKNHVIYRVSVELTLPLFKT